MFRGVQSREIFLPLKTTLSYFCSITLLSTECDFEVSFWELILLSDVARIARRDVSGYLKG